jgi:flagellar biosynthesis component FlhA
MDSASNSMRYWRRGGPGFYFLLINIIGGFMIGMAQHGLSAAQAADTYILLAVGDALVAQIPGLLTVAAAMVVSRLAKTMTSVAKSSTKCLFQVLGITAVIAGIAGHYSGMPTWCFSAFLRCWYRLVCVTSHRPVMVRHLRSPTVSWDDPCNPSTSWGLNWATA